MHRLTAGAWAKFAHHLGRSGASGVQAIKAKYRTLKQQTTPQPAAVLSSGGPLILHHPMWNRVLHAVMQCTICYRKGLSDIVVKPAHSSCNWACVVLSNHTSKRLVAPTLVGPNPNPCGSQPQSLGLPTPTLWGSQSLCLPTLAMSLDNNVSCLHETSAADLQTGTVQ